MTNPALALTVVGLCLELLGLLIAAYEVRRRAAALARFIAAMRAHTASARLVITASGSLDGLGGGHPWPTVEERFAALEAEVAALAPFVRRTVKQAEERVLAASRADRDALWDQVNRELSKLTEAQKDALGGSTWAYTGVALLGIGLVLQGVGAALGVPEGVKSAETGFVRRSV